MTTSEVPSSTAPGSIDRKLKVLVTGSTGWPRDQISIIAEALEKVRQEAAAAGRRVLLVHGAAIGADKYADTIAQGYGWEIRGYRAPWEMLGAAAGPDRNRTLWNAEHQPPEDPVDLVLAFPTLGSKGTWDMLDLALMAGVVVRYYQPRTPGDAQERKEQGE